MHIATQIVALVVAVLVVTAVARRLNLSAPLCLVVVGVAASFVPGIPEYQLDSELVLVGLLPPLLYATAIRTSLIDFHVYRGPIVLLSVGLVVFTTVGVGAVAWLVIPGLPLAAGIALGAVVAPPDAVAATAVARRVGMPRPIVRILEGESLVNDAAALVSLRTAIAAIAGSVSVWDVAGDFALAAGGGIAGGLVIGAIASAARKRNEDLVTDTAISLVVPFLAYLAAEAVHGSGVLSVVIAGLMLGHQAPRLQSGSARLASMLNWRTIQFLLENVVFLLIGLQLRGIITSLDDTELGLGTLAAACTAVLVATLLTRFVWIFGIGLTRRIFKGRSWPWSYSAVMSWAGMRGVVTLAAVFVLPQETPQRPVLVFAAFVVVAGTLLLQGTTLPVLVRRLRLPPPDPGEDALQGAKVLDEMTRAGLERLDEVRRDGDPAEVIDRLRDRARQRSDSAWEQLGAGSDVSETPSEAHRRLRLQMLDAERERLLAARTARSVDHDVLRRVLEALDIEESMLEALDNRPTTGEGDLRTPEATAVSCEHLRHAPEDTSPSTTRGCEQCLIDGTSWVHLRMCLACGYVGCCDSSPGRHSGAHFEASRHAVMRSFEPGEAWRWCFIHEALG